MWTWPPKLRLICSGRSAPDVLTLNTCAGGAVGCCSGGAVGWTQLFAAPVIAVALVALLTRRPMELKQTAATPLMVTFALALDNTPESTN